jgi:hypothetical protein
MSNLHATNFPNKMIKMGLISRLEEKSIGAIVRRLFTDSTMRCKKSIGRRLVVVKLTCSDPSVTAGSEGR